MNRRTKKVAIFLYVMIFSISMFAYLATFSNAQDYEFEHSGDVDDPVIVKSLEGAKITWKILNCSGVFADVDTEPGDLIRYKVEEANPSTEEYKVTEAVKFWGDNDFSDYSREKGSSYYLINRDWGQMAINYFETQDSAFWGNMEEIDRNYNAEYLTEWWDWKLMDTVTISYEMNKTNYDIIKFSRAEGILLKREAVVNTYDGEVRGYLNIELEDYSQGFELSLWYYFILILGIIAIVAIVIITISLSIQRRKRAYREIKEI